MVDSIVRISSIVGTDGNIGQSNYGVSKGGVISMSKGWAKELSRKGVQIRINYVAPGFFATDMTKNLSEKVIQMMEGKGPLGRMGSVKDIANGFSFQTSNNKRPSCHQEGRFCWQTFAPLYVEMMTCNILGISTLDVSFGI